MNGDTFDWVGANGVHYTYKVLLAYDTWNEVPGNYIFVRMEGYGLWSPLYIGETESLWKRLGPHHEKWSGALDLGMSHIHAHVSSPDKLVRLEEEQSLIRFYRPPLND